MRKEMIQNNEKIAPTRPLIVSYSYSGNTHRIAQEIQSATGGDWCEIYPWQPYPMAFPELLRQVKKRGSISLPAKAPSCISFTTPVYCDICRLSQLVRDHRPAPCLLVI